MSETYDDKGRRLITPGELTVNTNTTLPQPSADTPTAGQGGLTEAITDVIVQHQRIPLYDGTQGQRCVGCNNLTGATDGPNSPRHAAHVAAHVAAALTARLSEPDVVEAAAAAMRTSRLSWGVHADRWGDVEWQREFWDEAARTALAAAAGVVR